MFSKINTLPLVITALKHNSQN